MRFKRIFCLLISVVLIISPLTMQSVAISSDLLELTDESTLVIDRSTGYITGFKPGTTYAEASEHFASEVVFYDADGNVANMHDKVTTFSAVATKDGSDVLTILIYGDVNSDGAVDGNDASIIEMLISGQLGDYELDKPNYDAAVYADRLDGLTVWDAEACFDSGLMSRDIPQSSQPDLPTDKTELLQIFNDTVNSVKSERPGVRSVRDSSIPSVTGEGFVSEQIADSIKGNTSSSDEIFVKGKSHDDAIPLAKKTWSSSLTVEDVKDIKCTDNGDGSFTITVYMPDETYDALNTKAANTIHGKIIDVCQFVPESGQEDWYTSVTAEYKGVTVKCTYNSYTGDFISADYNITYQVHMLGKLSLTSLLYYPIDVTVDYIQKIQVTKT